jgi:hypothetical protein
VPAVGASQMLGIFCRVGCSHCKDSAGCLGGISGEPLCPFEPKRLTPASLSESTSNRPLLAVLTPPLLAVLAAWALRDSGAIAADVAVTDSKVTIFGQGVGMASLMARIELSYSGPSPHGPPRMVTYFVQCKISSLRSLSEPDQHRVAHTHRGATPTLARAHAHTGRLRRALARVARAGCQVRPQTIHVAHRGASLPPLRPGEAVLRPHAAGTTAKVQRAAPYLKIRLLLPRCCCCRF